MLTSWTQAVAFTAVSLAAMSLAPSSSLAALSVDERTDQILANMTLDHLVGQMTQIGIGSVLVNGTLNETRVAELAQFKVGSYLASPFFNGPIDGKTAWTVDEWRSLITRLQEINMKENGGHPIIYGVDSVHGAILAHNATYFGQQINAGASFRPDLVTKLGEITAKDTLATAVPWIFGPILEISQNKMWARTYETFGEDPHLVSVMGAALIKGIQAKNEVAACMKHFVGYSKTPTGHDRDGVSMSDFELLNRFLPPFLAAVDADVKTGMQNYISINGVPTVASSKILRDLLRHDMGFEGFIVSDYNEIRNLNDFHHVAKTPADGVKMALTHTSLDMNMASYGTNFTGFAKAAWEKDGSLIDRIKESARRIVKAKVELGLYDTPVPGSKYVATLGQAEDRQVALEIARESIVLLQNNNSVLPLAETSKVFLTGHSADDIGNLCGGWTLAWQGYSGNKYYPHGTSIKQGIEAIAGKDAVQFFNGLNVTGTFSADDLAKAKDLAAKAEYTIAVIGEGPYAEKPGDIEDPYLPRGQIEYVKQLASTGAKIILVLVGGRPRLLDGLPANVHAVVNAMLPCEAGGQAVAEVLYGKVNPSGRLPITYPKFPSGVDIQYNHYGSTQCTDGLAKPTKECEMQWDFGTGLSYTTFKYTDMKLSVVNVTSEADKVSASVTVTNNGMRAGKETVMLFLTQPYRELSVPEVKELKAFEKIELQPNESKTVSFDLTYKDWSVFKPQIGQGFSRVAEPGEFVVAFKPETKCDVYNATAVVDLCAKFQLVAAN